MSTDSIYYDDPPVVEIDDNGMVHLRQPDGSHPRVMRINTFMRSLAAGRRAVEKWQERERAAKKTVRFKRPKGGVRKRDRGSQHD